MNLLKDENFENILTKKIKIELTVCDFLTMYFARMVCLPNEVKDYANKMFPCFENVNFLMESTNTEQIEEIIDELNIPHKEWL